MILASTNVEPNSNGISGGTPMLKSVFVGEEDCVNLGRVYLMPVWPNYIILL